MTLSGPDPFATYDRWGYPASVAFTHDGRRVACVVDGGTIAANHDAPPEDPMWRVAVGGRETRIAFPMEHADTPARVRDQAVAALASPEDRAFVDAVDRTDPSRAAGRDDSR